MSNPLQLCLALHNHQPVGNFDGVFQQAYEDSYRPFLDVFEPFDNLRISLHTSGPLMEWLEANHSDYLDRLANLVQAGRIEIIGGAYYESILPMIPSRDRVGQIQSYSKWLTDRLGANIRGMWMPERVWEQTLTSDLVRAGIDYTILDDFHFKNAGVSDEELNGYFITEDDGNVLRIFPGNENLRYKMPFRDPQETIDYLGFINEKHPNSVIVFGDDGEKFGSWPETHEHVYTNGWLRRFFEAISANEHWIRTTTLSDALDNSESCGKVYLPDGSYREMTEWALPAKKQVEFENLTNEFEHDGRWDRIKQFARGGFWRNFKTKYPETDEMYSRMMVVSQRLQSLRDQGVHGEKIDAAERELYRGQCNCAYWHGAFGGVYLPHLRNAIYNHLIAADNLMDEAIDRGDQWIEAEAFDFNLDGLPEVSLTNSKINCLIAPKSGGHMYELDVRSICHNLLATFTRREEAYHDKIRHAHEHSDVKCKQEGLDQLLQVDPTRRKSLVDRFYDQDVSVEAVSRNEANDLGDFATGDYEAKIRRNEDRIQVQLYREGQVGDHQIRLTKAITLNNSSSTLEIAYKLENLPQHPLHFGVELNFAGMPSGADNRFFHRCESTGDKIQPGQGENLGQLGALLSLSEIEDLGLVDQWLGLDVQLVADRPTNFWTFPIETVSQSEGGFEAVHQSTVVQPHWIVEPNENGEWMVTIRLTADTSLAENHSDANAEPAFS